MAACGVTSESVYFKGIQTSSCHLQTELKCLNDQVVNLACGPASTKKNVPEPKQVKPSSEASDFLACIIKYAAQAIVTLQHHLTVEIQWQI